MKIAIYGRPVSKSSITFIYDLFTHLNKYETKIYVHTDFYSFLNHKFNFFPIIEGTFKSYNDLHSDFDFMLSIGGDGTFLESVYLTRDKGIPIVGINSGRLGFLANITKENTLEAIEHLIHGKYRLESRTLLALESQSGLFGEANTALNEVTVIKNNSSSMITIKVYIDDEFLNSYWTDGLIISTPTGSTGYSLSVGGPIIMPGTNNFVISPIASHNLTVRPMVVPDDKVITIEVDGREDNYLATLDFRSKAFDKKERLTIKKANYDIQIVTFEDYTFFKTIREKLMWGLDKRN